jgi:hypothetical protein
MLFAIADVSCFQSKPKTVTFPDFIIIEQLLNTQCIHIDNNLLENYFKKSFNNGEINKTPFAVIEQQVQNAQDTADNFLVTVGVWSHKTP